MIKNVLIGLAVVGITTVANAQNNTSYWQQEAKHTMTIDVDVEDWKYKGSQELLYTNNSPIL